MTRNLGTFATAFVVALALAGSPAEAANFFKQPGRWFKDSGRAINNAAIHVGHEIEKHPVETIAIAGALVGGYYLITSGTPLTVHAFGAPLLRIHFGH